MTATRTILLALICSAASVTLAAQEAEADASKKEDAPKTEKTESAQPGQIPMIFGIPGQTLRQWQETLDAALSLCPEHISAYGLIPEEGTPLFRRLENKEVELPDPELERQMYDLAIRKLHAAGLEQYEISNFARKGFECRHNIGYWDQLQYIGLGLSASSMLILDHHSDGLTCLRKTNPSDPEIYR